MTNERRKNMRRFIIPFLILTFLLTACGTFEVTLTNSNELTPTLAPDSLAAGPAPLGMSSTSTEIRQLLLESPFRWQTIFMDAQVTSPSESPQHMQVWVDQPTLSFRVLSGPADASAETLRAADGMSLLDLNLQTGESNLSPFLGESMDIPFTPQAPDLSSANVVESHPLSTSIGAHLGELLFPSDIAQNEGTFKPVGMEVIAYRLALIVEWAYIQNSLPSYRAWVDVSTGVLLRYQQFEKSGGTEVLSEVTVTRVDYNLPFSPELFSVNISAMPKFVSDPVEPSVVTVMPAPTSGTQDPLGSVYSFVADDSYPVRVMRLVSLPAACVTGASDCPEAEVIPTPVELTSSLQPLVWSSTHNEAAWAYPVNADQRIWTLYLFDPLKKSWKELVQMDRYMDPPMWSRDGAWLAFRVQNGQGGSEVFAVRRDGSDLKNLTATDKLPAEGQPYVMDAWLGENVVLRSSVPGQAGTVYLMRVEDGFVKPFFDTLLTKAQFIESPDGTLLAYVDYETNSQKQLVKIITPDGKTLRDLATFASGSVLGLAWSPDGAQLAFSHRTDSTSSVYVIDSDGRNLRQVYMSATDTQFVFSPDGKYLLVQTIDGTGEHLYSVDLSTLQSHLVQAPGIALNEAWMLPSWVR
jgi:hypothetical protein